MTKRLRADENERGQKRVKTSNPTPTHPTWPLLQAYYRDVSTLRQFLLSPSAGLPADVRQTIKYCGSSLDDDATLVHLLDSAIVGVPSSPQIAFSQRDLSEHIKQLALLKGEVLQRGRFTQTQIVDFVIWHLIGKDSWNRKYHLLSHGFYSRIASAKGADVQVVPGAPGVLVAHHNPYVEALREHPWTALCRLVGSRADEVLSRLLLQCGVFVPVGMSGNLSQISGIAMYKLKRKSNGEGRGEQTGGVRVHLVSHRMVLRRPALGANGNVVFGLGPKHVLNVYRDLEDSGQTRHVLKFVFPRQFRLQNVFVQEPDSDRCQNYQSREDEVKSLRTKNRIPKRLGNGALELVYRLRKRHARCSYHALLQHYCPPTVSGTTVPSESMTLATDTTQVSAFCHAVISKVFPAEFWGDGAVREHNQRALMVSVDRFINLPRFTSMSLNTVLEPMQVQSVSWLIPPQCYAKHMSRTDFTKRRELLAELIYYLFDSFLIPLIGGCFHVTESNMQRNKLFYFRHDVWKAMTEPALASLRSSIFEECSKSVAQRMLSADSLGVSQLRFLPKENGMRPIMNLQRRASKIQSGSGKSINEALTPAFSVLNYEREKAPKLLGSALFSVDEILPRLRAFRASLKRQKLDGRRLYFGKLDVKACFDTIPQQKLLAVVQEALQGDSYQVSEYARAKLIGSSSGTKPSWKHVTKASSNKSACALDDKTAEEILRGRNRTVCVDLGMQNTESCDNILKLLQGHVLGNMVKVGKSFYIQKRGIPQGSKVSSLLCNYIYGDLEQKVLAFLGENSLLLRMVDDFLVISTEKDVVERLMKLMHNGLPEYGVQVKAEKSRTNFPLVAAGQRITSLPQATDFPFCGHAINTISLDLTKDHERQKAETSIAYSKAPGHSFRRKTLNALKLQMHAMLLTTEYNKVQTVLYNVHRAFSITAQKSRSLIRALPRQPRDQLIIETVEELINLASALIRRRKHIGRQMIPFECEVSRAQVRWLACSAFYTAFQRRTQHQVLLVWLRSELDNPGVRAQRSICQPAICSKQSRGVKKRSR